MTTVKQQVVVVGGQGFLGKHVMRILAERAIPAISLSRASGLDLIDLAATTARLADLQPTAIINCAAHVGSVHYVLEHPADLIHDNSLMVVNLYRAVQQACPRAKVVNPLSNCSYPGDASNFHEPDWQRGLMHPSVFPYGMTRRLIHALAESYHMQYGVRTVNWLVANAYGPGDRHDPNLVHALNGIVIRLIRGQRAGARTFEIWGSGKPTREWAYIEDAARILVDSLTIDEQIYPVNLAQNKGYSIAEIAQIVARLLDYPVEFVFNTDYADGAPCKVHDDRQFRAKCPDFQFTPLDVGIARTIEYYRSAL